MHLLVIIHPWYILLIRVLQNVMKVKLDIWWCYLLTKILVKASMAIFKITAFEEVKTQDLSSHHRIHYPRYTETAIFNWFGWLENGKYWIKIYAGGLSRILSFSLYGLNSFDNLNKSSFFNTKWPLNSFHYTKYFEDQI